MSVSPKVSLLLKYCEGLELWDVKYGGDCGLWDLSSWGKEPWKQSWEDEAKEELLVGTVEAGRWYLLGSGKQGWEEGSKGEWQQILIECLSNDTEIITPILQMRILRLKKLNNLLKVRQLDSGITVTWIWCQCPKSFHDTRQPLRSWVSISTRHQPFPSLKRFPSNREQLRAFGQFWYQPLGGDFVWPWLRLPPWEHGRREACWGCPVLTASCTIFT